MGIHYPCYFAKLSIPFLGIVLFRHKVSLSIGTKYIGIVLFRHKVWEMHINLDILIPENVIITKKIAICDKTFLTITKSCSKN